MAKRSSHPEESLNELYREHPKEFVARRNELAKELRGAGERDEADRVKKLRRPTVAAWLINRTALESPRKLREFDEASSGLERAQEKALEGGDAAAKAWRAAVKREREATGAVVDAAAGHAEEAGHPAAERALQLVDETLRAAGADPGLRERVLEGRVEREQAGATLGTRGDAPRPRRAPSGSSKRRDLAQAQRELKRLEGELAEATARAERLRASVDQTAEALRREKERLADSRREATGLRRKVQAAKRRAKG